MGYPDMRFAGSRLGSPWGRGWRCPLDHHSPPEAAHQACSEPGLQRPPLQLWVTCSCRKTGPEQNPAPGHPSGVSCPSSSPRGPWDSRLTKLPFPQGISRVLGQALSSSPQKFPFGLLKTPLHAGSARSGQARSPGQPASTSPASALHTGQAPASASQCPSPRIRSHGAPTLGWDPARRLAAPGRAGSPKTAACRGGRGQGVRGWCCGGEHRQLPDTGREPRFSLASGLHALGISPSICHRGITGP